MTPPADGPVVVDTGVFSVRLLTGSNHLEFASRATLDGRPLVISFVTRAELRYGASLGNWGACRLARLDEHLARVETAWPDEREAAPARVSEVLLLDERYSESDCCRAARHRP